MRDKFRVPSVSAEICTEHGFPLRSAGSQEGLVAMGCIGCQ